MCNIVIKICRKVFNFFDKTVAIQNRLIVNRDIVGIDNRFLKMMWDGTSFFVHDFCKTVAVIYLKPYFYYDNLNSISNRILSVKFGICFFLMCVRCFFYAHGMTVNRMITERSEKVTIWQTYPIQSHIRYHSVTF